MNKYEFVFPLALFILFLAITLPGISWGAPSTWHPDEIVVRSIKALHGEWVFDEINFDYPSLPQYAMFFLGKAVLAFGGGEGEILVASRILSAVLAGLTIALTYFITRRAGGNIYIAGLSGMLLLSVSEMQHNGRFAHNDTYITFFVALTILFLVNYRRSDHRAWLYASFIGVGMAASSKYNAISLVLVPVFLYLFSKRHSLSKRPLRILETLFIGGALTFLGFAAGTPKSLFWMSFYFKRMIPALIRTGNYARQPDSLRGILGQYPNFADGVGLLLFILFSAAFLWGCYKIFQGLYQGKPATRPLADSLLIFILSILALDVPIMLSYNYQTRFFLPMMPLFAVLGALFIEDLYRFARQQERPIYPGLVHAALGLILLFSFARNISVMSLFMNDARIPASEFIKTLPPGTSLEHTLYPPTIPADHFEREHNYPIHFIKIMGGSLPTSTRYVFNAGEAGLDERMTDYLVTDSFTSSRFSDPYICQSMQVECDFFKQLETGRSNRYQLLAEFSYTLPPYLPQTNIAFVNPAIRIYERVH
ncbi:MAG TPA: phospholipid carrier-dependent glycosyltransferase [Anaerolineales bacterium]|nr:phospholipid carrier-dependent glycosyltransferase [Anaerolineales bacterium]